MTLPWLFTWFAMPPYDPTEEFLFAWALPDWLEAFLLKKFPAFEFDFELACMLELDDATMATFC